MCEKTTLHIFEMKWYALEYCHLLLFIFSDCFLPTNGLPASSKSFGKYRKDISETSKNELHSYPEEEIENTSEDCFSIVEYSEITAPEKPSKATKKRKMSSPDEIPKEVDSLLTNTVEELKNTADEETHKFSGWMSLIYPGTKWCGIGNIAANDEDLGPEVETDKCCRAHDKCDDFIENGETKYNLTNKSKFISLSCECDNELYECLRKANTISSNSVGFLYFNFFARQCFDFDYPQKCIKYKSILKICTEFVTDTLAEKVYQWFPAKKYKKL